MIKRTTLTLCVLLVLSSSMLFAQESKYTFKKGDYSGIGKWYFDREIAHVMGYQGMDWLERDEREAEENTTTLLENMNIAKTDDIADIGAGSGYHVFKMAKMATEGTIYAVDIQDEMLVAMMDKKEAGKFDNVELVKGGEKSVNLKPNSVDKVLIVDVYHEMSFPYEMMASLKKALRSNGKLYLIEYRGEDPKVPIKRLHKMTEAHAIKELKAVGFKLKENISNLPWQHCMVFVKSE
ncbi:class I SAM-dependent methyltransferase [Croceitalea sp. MTPC9]|uniref:class I SAM-dependent methyltransferase n=1 Tax=unclassified Croceitalea TaxID=2632280 RepID=UPI002B3E7EE3|nr:class I SAM-dependent methyltransferase [Croceitalea sp. MTPC6]GMN15384.1 class I SAM-dependent methyltransferase [Croceitalea sp. MTPC9]